MQETHVSRRQVIKGASIVGAAGLAALVPTATVARADGNHDDDSIVGAWLGTATLGDGTKLADTLLSFGSGGTLVHSASIDLQNTAAAPNLSTPSYGAWKRTRAGQYSVHFFFFTFDNNTNPVAGPGEVTEHLTVDRDKLHGTFTLTIGNTTLMGTILATRIQAV